MWKKANRNAMAVARKKSRGNRVTGAERKKNTAIYRFTLYPSFFILSTPFNSFKRRQLFHVVLFRLSLD